MFKSSKIFAILFLFALCTFAYSNRYCYPLDINQVFNEIENMFNAEDAQGIVNLMGILEQPASAEEKQAAADAAAEVTKLTHGLAGNMEIIDFMDGAQIRDDEYASISISDAYFKNTSNQVAHSLRKVKYGNAGEGFLKIYFPAQGGPGSEVGSKPCAIFWGIKREGNYDLISNLTTQLQAIENKYKKSK